MIPTPRLLLAAIAPAVLALAALADETLLWPTVALDLGLALVAGFDALLGRRPLVQVGREAPEVLSIGRANPVTLELRSRARRELLVEVTDDLFPEATSADLPATVRLPPRGHATVRYGVRPARRGGYALGDHHVRYATPLGLFRRRLTLAARHPVKVYPDVQAVRTYELLARQDRELSLVRTSRLRGGESEFERLREYRRDDEFRKIDWKATARRQKLIARDYQLERNQNIVFLLDCGRLMTTETDGLSHLDHALNAMLMVAHVAARSGDHVGLLAFDDAVRTFVPPAGGARAARRLIQASYDLHASLVEPNYDAAVRELALRVRKRALVVLFTDVIDDVNAARVVRLLRSLSPRHLPLCVLFRDLEVERLVEPSPGREDGGGEPDIHLRGATAELIAFRDHLIRDLKAGGALVLDTPPSRLTPALINRYLHVKARQLL